VASGDGSLVSLHCLAVGGDVVDGAGLDEVPALAAVDLIVRARTRVADAVVAGPAPEQVAPEPPTSKSLPPPP
jgi:hypothetical protein